MSYRNVAREGGVSLALVNYYFPSKSDLLASTSSHILADYKLSFERAAERFRRSEGCSFVAFVRQAFRNAVWRDRAMALAWAEIMLDAVRHEESLDLAREWHDQLTALWTEIAKACGEPTPVEAARMGIDIVIGLVFIAFGIALTEDEEATVFSQGDPERDGQSRQGCEPSADRWRVSEKAIATRARIVEAAIDILVSEGPAAANFRRIAQRASLSLSAPAYYFATINDLLCQAQITLLAASKDRYRAVMLPVDRSMMTRDELAQLTAAIMLREATMFHRENLSFFANWIEAARRPELRGVIWSFVRDQRSAWQRVLHPIRECDPLPSDSGLLAEALFIGKLIRLLSVGARVSDLADVPTEWAAGLDRLLEGGL